MSKREYIIAYDYNHIERSLGKLIKWLREDKGKRIWSVRDLNKYFLDSWMAAGCDSIYDFLASYDENDEEMRLYEICLKYISNGYRLLVFETDNVEKQSKIQNNKDNRIIKIQEM